MSPKTTRRIAAIIAIALAVIMVVTSFGWVFASSSTAYGMSQEEETYTDEQLAFMKKLISYLQDNYKDSIDVKTLLEGAYSGMIESLDDPYSVYYVSEEEKDAFIDAVKGEFFGIGVSLENRDGKCVVIAPMAETPAEKAGIRSGDVITAVDGVSMEGKTTKELVKFLRGVDGTMVNVTIDRGGTTLEFSLKRVAIQINSVSGKILEGKIGYIRVTSFDNDTATEFRNVLSKLMAQGAGSYIVDIRNNTGGYTDQAAEIAGIFMEAGPVVHFIQQGKTVKTLETTGENRVKAPVVLLVNHGSASASEILAGAWQDTKTATVVGTTTYGKGVAQQVLSLKNGYSMKLSLYYFVTPKRNTIDKVGITPDVTVDQRSTQEQEEMAALYDTFVPMSEATKPTLGEQGLNVYGAQQRLSLLGYNVPVTGTLDWATFVAIKQFQSAEGLWSYGRLDLTTRTHLDQAITKLICGTGDDEDLQLEKAIEILKKK